MDAPNTKRRILIAGCGYVGSALGAQLTAGPGDLWEVWGLKRRPEGLPAGVRPLAADLADPRTLDGLPDGLDAVVYAASAGVSTEAAYEAAYVRGLENLLAALAKGGQRIERLLFVSSTGVYGDQQGGRVDEDTPAEPDRFSGRILLDGERLARSGPIPAIVLRLGGIYGPGRDRLVREVAEGRALRSAAPVITNRIHRDDAAGALAHLLALKDPEPLYLGVDREPADLGEVITWIARELGLPPPPVATADEARAGRLSRGSKRCSSDRLAASGYTFSYPTFREGYGAMLRARG